jgi:cell division septation protein DedD
MKPSTPRKKMFTGKGSPPGRHFSPGTGLVVKVVGALSVCVIVVMLLTFIWKNKPEENREDSESGRNRVVKEIPKEDAAPFEPRFFGPQGDEPPAETDAQHSGIPASSGTQVPPVGIPAEPAPEAEMQPPEGPAASLSAEIDSEETAAVKSEEASLEAPEAEPPAPPRKPEAQMGSKPAEGPQFIVQVGAFKDEANAQKLSRRLEERGLSVQVNPYDHPKLGPLFLVRLTPFADESRARAAMAEIEQREKIKTLLIRSGD